MTEDIAKQAEDMLQRNIFAMQSMLNRMESKSGQRRSWRWIRSGLKGNTLERTFCRYWAAYTYQYAVQMQEARRLWPIL